MTQQQKVLVAVVGASGGVGSATVKAALAAGHQVRVLARSRTKLCAVLGDDVVAQLDAVVLGDVLNPETLDELMNAKRVQSGGGAQLPWHPQHSREALRV